MTLVRFLTAVVLGLVLLLIISALSPIIGVG